MHRRRNKLAISLAIFALLLQAFWPLLAQARPGPQTMLVQLCTIDGITHYAEIPVRVDAPAEEHTSIHSGHCVMCVFGAERVLALPSLKLLTLDPAIPVFELPADLTPAKLRITSHPPAQPRAPPGSA
jgi:hypothetical protein